MAALTAQFSIAPAGLFCQQTAAVPETLLKKKSPLNGVFSRENNKETHLNYIVLKLSRVFLMTFEGLAA